MRKRSNLIFYRFCFLCLSCYLHADEPVLPDITSYDLSNVPPSATQLLQQERQIHNTESLEAIKKVVNDIVDQKTKRRKKQGVRRTHSERSVKNDQGLQSAIVSLMQQNTLSQEIIAMLEKQLNDPQLHEKKISITLKKMPVKDALSLIAKSTGIQLVVDGDVTGTVPDTKLDDIPLAAALHSILLSNEPRLTMIKDFGVWRVLKMQTAREIFANMALRDRENDFASLVIAILYAKWNDTLKNRIEKLWQGITQGLTDKNSCYLVLDDVNKKIFCKGRKQHVADFEQCMRELDIKIPQIRIDARVVLASKDFEEALGFRWSGVYNRRASVKHTDFVGLGPFRTDNGDGSDADTDFNKIVGWSLNLIPTSIKNTIIKIPFVFGNQDMNTKRLTLELNAAESRSEAKTILKPSLLVYNEEVAEILVGEQLPHEVRLDETIESRLTNITSVNYKDIGMKIKVKPMVAPGHTSVFLDVFVENSMVTKPEFFIVQGANPGDDTGKTQSGFNYVIKTSRSTNRVLLKSGQTTLIGGLLTNSKSKDQQGVPFLKDIPVLGWFFKGRRKFISDEQLLIFITPTLITV